MNVGMPLLIGLCPNPDHTLEFFVEMHEDESALCPECSQRLVLFRREEEDAVE